MTAAPFVRFRRLSIRMPWWVVIAVTTAWLLFHLVVWSVLLLRFCARHIRSAPAVLVVVIALWAWLRYGWLPVALVAVVIAAVVAGWYWRWTDSCTRWVVLPALAVWRRLWVYRRQWNEAMTLCGLVKTFDDDRKVPTLLRVKCSYATDEVTVRMPRGQNPEVYHKAAPNLAYSFGTRHCRVFSTRRVLAPVRTGRLAWLLVLVDRVRYRDRPRLVTLVFIRRDPLTATVPPFPVPARPDFAALPMGLREDMERYLLCLLATHLLVIGATRAGKGSVIWSLIRALAAGVKAGLVRLWVIDPKGGMEMAMGRPMYARYEDTDYARMADLLDDAVTVMRDRQSRLAGKVRVHTPTLGEPLIVIIIDELACLTAYLQDTDLKNRIKQSLGLLLSQGTGLGVLVVGASQDPRKEVVELRDLFPTRIGLRLNESGHVNLVLGDGARDRGAYCDQIPNDRAHKGIGYVQLDDQPEPARVRFSYIDDDLIRDMANAFPAPADPTPVPARARVRDGKAIYTPAAPLLPKTLLDALNPEPGGESA